MAREWIDERNYRILHNRYNDKGEVVEQFYVYYTENETADKVYIKPQIIMDNRSGKGTASGNFEGRDKVHVLECEELGFVGDNCPAIKGYSLEHDDEWCRCIFFVIEGEDIIIETTDGADTFELDK